MGNGSEDRAESLPAVPPQPVIKVMLFFKGCEWVYSPTPTLFRNMLIRGSPDLSDSDVHESYANMIS
jgi:hypothetical protein